MLTPMMGNALPDDRLWAADTGCFGAPQKHSDDGYLRWLEKRHHGVDRCLFATAPDVVKDAHATMARSMPMLPRIREVGYKAALVAQDGLEEIDVPWDAFDCLFMGGSTEWKLGVHAKALMREARRQGKWVHCGRVNSKKRYLWSIAQGAHSSDGTFVAFGPDTNIPRLRRWFVD